MKYSKFENSKESIGLLFWQVSTKWSRMIKEALKQLELTHIQFVVIAVAQEINDNEILCTQKKISDFSKIDVMTVSSTIKFLVQRGLVTRIEHENDTRAKIVKNTKSGQEILIKANKIVEETDEIFFSDLGTNILEFKKYLEKLKLFSQ